MVRARTQITAHRPAGIPAGFCSPREQLQLLPHGNSCGVGAFGPHSETSFSDPAPRGADQSGVPAPEEPSAVIVDGGPAGLAAAWAASVFPAPGAAQTLLISVLPASDVEGSGNPGNPRRKAIATLAGLCNARRVVELVVPPNAGRLYVNEIVSGPARSVLTHMLLESCAEAMGADVSRVLWPVVPGAATDAELRTEVIADCCDRSLLVGQLASLDAPRTGPGSRGVRVETPYADVTDRQLAELLLDLGAPLAACWWCEGRSERACGSCAACARWSAALHRAGARVPAGR